MGNWVDFIIVVIFVALLCAFYNLSKRNTKRKVFLSMVVSVLETLKVTRHVHIYEESYLYYAIEEKCKQCQEYKLSENSLFQVAYSEHNYIAFAYLILLEYVGQFEESDSERLKIESICTQTVIRNLLRTPIHSSFYFRFFID